MCGRYSLTNPSKLREEFGSDIDGHRTISPRFNIAPGQVVPVIRICQEGKMCISEMRWGFLPNWASKTNSYKPMINARSESIFERKYFRDSIKRQRVLIPADGYYEWMYINNKKVPYRITKNNHGLFAFAGVWERPSKNACNKFPTFAIITRNSIKNLSVIHQRMPVILSQGNYLQWLNKRLKLNLVESCLSEMNNSNLEGYPVNSWVNDIRNDDVKCIQTIDSSGNKIIN
ncbi:MAG: hypothetical protein CMM30_04590 [Rhodospirillaceae bacterium]|nr:hypothetical protein [Rhodospirillaceae bacterium]|tara:strand:+ start:12274 stop:12966 length:693 start_codon:yes stop_codon:yes gene_type:complete